MGHANGFGQRFEEDCFLGVAVSFRERVPYGAQPFLMALRIGHKLGIEMVGENYRQPARFCRDQHTVNPAKQFLIDGASVAAKVFHELDGQADRRKAPLRTDREVISLHHL